MDFGKWGEKRPLNGVKKKIYTKSFFAAAILHPFSAKKYKSETTYFHYFSPRILNILKVWTLDFKKLGQKDRKQSEQSGTDRQTHKTKTNKKWQNPL